MYNLAINCAIEAGKAILEVYHKADFNVELKNDNSPVTDADNRAHDIIFNALTQTNLPVLSEEGNMFSYDERSNWTTFWLVDPLDGTREFIKKNGEFSVNIALVEDGLATFGIVYVPTTGELYVGGSNILPYKVIGSEKKYLNKKQSTTTLNILKAKQNIRIVTSRSHLSKSTLQWMDDFENPRIVTMGSSLKFMAIAEGKADIYPRFAPTMEWDTAASHAILNALNYQVLQINSSQELIYNKENLLNPYFICY